jgi:hypothetical protein
LKTLDIVQVTAVVVTFAVLFTAHVCIVAGLVRRTPRWRSPVALVVAPLAPYWAFRDRMYVRGTAWVVAAVAYAIARGVAG